MAAATKPKGRSLWWQVHHWVGLKVSLFMTFILLTGTLAVFAHEIDWAVTPAMRVMPRDAPPASWGTLAAAAAVEARPGERLTTIFAPIDPWFAAEAWIGAERGPPRRVYLDPWTGQVTGTHGWANVHRFLRQVHRHLMLPATWGIPLVCTLSILLLLSLVTGLVTYKKWWRGFLRRPAGRGRKLAGDLHRLGGLWSLWFVALMAASGIWYLVESLGGGAPVTQPPTISAAPPPTGARLDALVATARAAKPDLRIRELRFQETRGVIVLGQAGAVLVRDRVNGVALDPSTGRPTGVFDGSTLTAHQRLSEMADPLHFGTFGGLATKLIWFLFGAVLTALSVTGVMIYAMRLAREQPDRSGVARARAGMGVWGYVSLALILLALALTPSMIGGAS